MLYVIVEGGVVQNICSDGEPQSVIVIDYDTDGADEARLTEMPDGPAFVDVWRAELIDSEVAAHARVNLE